MVKWGEEFGKIHPKMRIDISAGGAGKGAADALAGFIQFETLHNSDFPMW
jgi:phosphate transport system substrate-binding protein